jgi:peroxiredoxin
MMVDCGDFRAIRANKRGKTMPLPDVGTMPPAFTLPNQHGEEVSLADFAGKNVLIWFYPRAFGNG